MRENRTHGSEGREAIAFLTPIPHENRNQSRTHHYWNVYIRRIELFSCNFHYIERKSIKVNEPARILPESRNLTEEAE